MSRFRFERCVRSIALLLSLTGVQHSVSGATPEQISASIARAQKWLVGRRSVDGTWELVDRPELASDSDSKIVDLKGRQWGGLTSLATYALLSSGVDRRAPELNQAIAFLLRANIQSTYGLGLSSQIVLFLPEQDSSALIKRNVAMLMGGLNQPPANMIRRPGTWLPIYGFYGYWTGFDGGTSQREFPKELNPRTIGSSRPRGSFDRSNSQYGVLGMRALSEAGGDVPTVYWQIIDAAWKKSQLSDGGWNYSGNTENLGATPSMTAAGLATLLITQEYVQDDNWNACKGAVQDRSIKKAFAWMDDHVAQCLRGDPYTLYDVERAGIDSGRRRFGNTDWYAAGADYLISRQNQDGSWSAGHGPIPDTSFAIIFLSQGRAPTFMSKLQYSSTHTDQTDLEVWNQRPNDLKHLCHWVAREDQTSLGWNSVTLQDPPELLHEAPILYISGSTALDFTKDEEDKLWLYVEQGGLILGNADCRSRLFANSFLSLGHKLFPKYDFTQCAPNDFVYTEQFKSFRQKPKVMELSNGVRKLMVLIPDSDPAQAWQMQSSTTKEEAFEIGANIFLYAVDKKNLLAKGVTYLVRPSAAPTTATLKVARIDAGDNPNPEPAGWTRMIGVMHNAHKIDMKVDLVKPEALAGYQVADLTGTGKVSFAAASRAAIKKFVDGGGTLIVDAAGGDAEFADSAENELAAIFPGQKPELIDANDPVYNYPNNKIEKVGWRTYAIGRLSDRKKPKLRGIKTGKRHGVFFSREDVSAGIVGQPVDGIYGYDPATATSLMAGMLLYAQAGGVLSPWPATAPANPRATVTNDHSRMTNSRREELIDTDVRLLEALEARKKLGEGSPELQRQIDTVKEELTNLLHGKSQ